MRLFVAHFAICTFAMGVYLTQDNQSQAGLMPVSDTVTANGSGTGYVYSYDLALTSNATLQAGDYVTIDGFRGLIPNQHAANRICLQRGVGRFVFEFDLDLYRGWRCPSARSTWATSRLTVQSQYNMTTTGSFTSLAQTLTGDRTTNSITQTQVTTPSGASCQLRNRCQHPRRSDYRFSGSRTLFARAGRWVAIVRLLLESADRIVWGIAARKQYF